MTRVLVGTHGGVLAHDAAGGVPTINGPAGPILVGGTPWVGEPPRCVATNGKTDRRCDNVASHGEVCLGHLRSQEKRNKKAK